MDVLLIMLALFAGLIAGPLLVTRLWPSRSQISGNALAGKCGSSPIFWGTTFGLGAFVAAIATLILAGPEELGNQATKLEIAAALFAMLAPFSAPLVICGFHTWKWNSDGLEFRGVFRRRLALWNEIVSVRRFKHTGWALRTSTGMKLSMASGYVPGERFIIAALIASRPDLAASVTAALADERPWTN